LGSRPVAGKTEYEAGVLHTWPGRSVVAYAQWDRRNSGLG
jgi:hypothetical protein